MHHKWGRSVSAQMEGSGCGSEWVLRAQSAISSGWLNNLAQKVCIGYRTAALTQTTVTDVWQPDLRDWADTANDFKQIYIPVSHLKGQNNRDEMYTADSSHTHNPLLSSDAFGCFEVLRRSKTHSKWNTHTIMAFFECIWVLQSTLKHPNAANIHVDIYSLSLCWYCPCGTP